MKSVSEAMSRDVRDLQSLITLHSYLNQDTVLESMELEKNHLPVLPEFSFSTLPYDAMLTSGRH